MSLKRLGLLAAGLLTLAVMGLFAATPIAWNSAGRPDESYPELIYFGLGLPMALVAVVAGALFARLSPSRSKAALIPLRATAGAAILACAWLAVVGLWPNTAFAGPSLDVLLSFGLPVLVVALIASVCVASRPAKAGAPSD